MIALSTRAVVDYEWVPRYVSYWDSDGTPTEVLKTEIIPLLEVHHKDPADFYYKLLDNAPELISVGYPDGYMPTTAGYIDYEFKVKKAGEGKYDVEIKDIAKLIVDVENKTIHIVSRDEEYFADEDIDELKNDMQYEIVEDKEMEM